MLNSLLPRAPRLVTSLPGSRARALIERDRAVNSLSYTRGYPLDFVALFISELIVDELPDAIALLIYRTVHSNFDLNSSTLQKS